MDWHPWGTLSAAGLNMTPDESERLPLHMEKVNGTTIVRLEAREIYSSFPAYDDVEGLKEKLRFLIDHGRHDLILDLGTAEYSTVMFLAHLIHASRRLQELGGRLRLCSLQPMIEEHFRICRCNRNFEIFSDVATALAAKRHG